jgi:hypothetical protein
MNYLLRSGAKATYYMAESETLLLEGNMRRQHSCRRRFTNGEVLCQDAQGYAPPYSFSGIADE